LRIRYRTITLLVVSAASITTGCIRRFPQRDGIAAPVSASEDALATRLRDHVESLADEIGPRSYQTPQQLDAAGEYVLGAFRSFVGDERAATAVAPLAAEVSRAAYTQMRWRNLRRCAADHRDARKAREARQFRAFAQQAYWNIEMTVPGTERPGEIIVIGAHYDSDACESGGANPGADDNASGVAVLLELAARFADRPLPRTLRFVAFTNEEEPFFQTDAMGSVQYVNAAQRRGDDMKAMMSLETLGYYSDTPDSQAAPQPFKSLLGLPDVGNFLAFVSSWRSRDLARRAVTTFHAVSSLPCEGFVAHPWLVEQVHWSDNWAFDEAGVPAFMVTDTAPGRNACYHKACDTSERLDYLRMARAVEGLASVIEALAQPEDLPKDSPSSATD